MIENLALISDPHLMPGDIFPTPRFEREPELVVVVGDTFNINPLGVDIWKSSEGILTVQSIPLALARYNWEILPGNHDPKKYLTELFKLAGVDKTPLTSLDVEMVSGRTYHIEHGDRYTPDWGIIAPFANWLVDVMTSHSIWLRQKWYSFCVWKGWLPSKWMEGGTSGNGKDMSHPEKIVALWAYIYYRYVSKQKKDYVIGHTHLRGGIQTGILGVPDLITLGANEWLELT